MLEGFESLSDRQRKAISHIKEVAELGAGRNSDFVSFETYRKIFHQLGNLEGKKIIEVGAGVVQLDGEHGTFLPPIIAEKKAKLIPVDYEHIFTRTWNLMRDAGGDVKIHPLTANALNLPFQDESIDGCVSVNLINFPWQYLGLEGHQAAYKFLSEICRVIKKGGFVIINSFGYNKDTLRNGSIRYNDEILENEIITSNEVRQLARSLGFTEISEIPMDDRRIRRSNVVQNEMKEADVVRVDIVEHFAFLIKK